MREKKKVNKKKMQMQRNFRGLLDVKLGLWNENKRNGFELQLDYLSFHKGRFNESLMDFDCEYISIVYVNKRKCARKDKVTRSRTVYLYKNEVLLIFKIITRLIFESEARKVLCNSERENHF